MRLISVAACGGVLGVCGKAASGKDTACAYFRALGIPEINVDRIGHLQLENKADELAAAFGPDILEDGGVSRQRLGALVFSDPAKLARLEAIVHPAMRTEVEHRIKCIEGPVLVNAALLYHMQLDMLCDHVLYIAAPEPLLITRLLLRPGMDLEKAHAILDAQKRVNPSGKTAETCMENVSTMDVFRLRLKAFAEDFFGRDFYASGRQTKKADVYPQP